jgi:competence protein ComEA
VGVVAVVLVAGWLWLSRPDPQPIPSAAPASVTVRPTTEAVSGPSPAATSVVVQVAGKVRHPGVVTLPSGSRVTDAITAVGGLLPGADPGPLNLARRVTDGEQILVAIPGTPAPAAAPAGGTGDGTGGGVPAPGAPLDLNSATLAQLQDLPGLGPVFAQRIIDYRTQHGGFRSVQELRQISGIGAHRFAQLQPLVRV